VSGGIDIEKPAADDGGHLYLILEKKMLDLIALCVRQLLLCLCKEVTKKAHRNLNAL
jgi:hypothetical protein